MSQDKRKGINGLLGRGEGAALTMKDLAGITGLNRDEIRGMIERERRNGIPILSNCRRGGYYLPDSESERMEFVRSMLHRSNEIKITARAILEAEIPDKEEAASGAANTESGKMEKRSRAKDYSSLENYITFADKQQE